ncbi:DNA-3-methyladenine glycosylase [soil metagenome]
MRGAKLIDLPAPEFDLQRTLESGQIFHAMPVGAGWQVLVDRTPLQAEQQGDRLRVSDAALAANYFALDHPLEEIYGSFPQDAFSQAALKACRGLRVLRQPHWECLATFITSPMKQVAHIRQISLHLRETYGEAIPGSLVAAYPSPERLAQATEEDLRACRLGFRAKGLLGTARAVASGSIDLVELAKKSTEEAREALCKLPGVGRKVANCVLLFAYERLDAVPVDVWIARILRAMRRRKSTNLQLEEFSGRRFGLYAGYVQQYLFHHARVTRTLPGR